MGDNLVVLYCYTIIVFYVFLKLKWDDCVIVFEAFPFQVCAAGRCSH